MFEDLDVVIDDGGETALRSTLQVRCYPKLLPGLVCCRADTQPWASHSTLLQKLFMNMLPATWVATLAAALVQHPAGFNHGATVVTSQLASPNAPAVAIVGDAAHATTWRLGYSLQNALQTVATLRQVMLSEANLARALEQLTSKRAPDMAALGQVDRVVRTCPLGVPQCKLQTAHASAFL